MFMKVGQWANEIIENRGSLKALMESLSLMHQMN